MRKVDQLSLVAIDREPQNAEQVNWARLIPGEAPFSGHARKKKPQSVRLGPSTDQEANASRGNRIERSRLATLEPRALRSRMGCKWLRSMAADWVLIALNWLIVGAVLVPLRELFPRVWSFGYAAGEPLSLLGVAILHAALITLIAYSEGLHLNGLRIVQQAEILAKSILWATALLCAADTLRGYPWTISALICGAGVLHFAALWGWRWRVAVNLNPERTDTRNVLIVGAGNSGRRIAAYLSRQPKLGRRVCGILDDARGMGDGVIGRVADLPRIARKEFVDEIILAGLRDSNLIGRVLNEAQRLRLDVQIVPELFGCNPAAEEIERLGDLALSCLSAEQLPAIALFLKRLLDVMIAGAALVFSLPALAVIAALIKLDSPGPVLYCAPRAGRKGRRFRCFKFRTMMSDADRLKSRLRRNNQRAGPFFKMWDDPRITRVGRLLRRYSLDELPQLWNVVRGEMSLVGPRPHPVDDVAGYEIEHLARLDVTPGITGLWQVTARRDPSFDRGMELDREYIHTWSLALDARILLRTVRAVVQGSGD
jgi:exopolysaccharide biosynthesis polyprenyl glycosylphosphotransferase